MQQCQGIRGFKVSMTERLEGETYKRASLVVISNRMGAKDIKEKMEFVTDN